MLHDDTHGLFGKAVAETGELDALVPANAATDHKSQGSEYPAVVIPVLTQHYAMLKRNLLYIGVTRGKRLMVHWSMTTLRDKLVKIGAKVVRHGRYVTFQLADMAVPRDLFRKILSLIDDLRRRPAPA